MTSFIRTTGDWLVNVIVGFEIGTATKVESEFHPEELLVMSKDIGFYSKKACVDCVDG